MNERLSIRHNGSIFIEDIQESDAGQYTCLAENIYGKVNATAALEVMGKSLLKPGLLIVFNCNHMQFLSVHHFKIASDKKERFRYMSDKVG